MDQRSSRQLRSWVIQRRTRSGVDWSAWTTIDESEFAPDEATDPGPMAPRAWGECTYFFADKVADDAVEWRLWNVRTGEADPQDPLG